MPRPRGHRRPCSTSPITPFFVLTVSLGSPSLMATSTTSPATQYASGRARHSHTSCGASSSCVWLLLWSVFSPWEGTHDWPEGPACVLVSTSLGSGSSCMPLSDSSLSDSGTSPLVKMSSAESVSSGGGCTRRARSCCSGPESSPPPTSMKSGDAEESLRSSVVCMPWPVDACEGPTTSHASMAAEETGWKFCAASAPYPSLSCMEASQAWFASSCDRGCGSGAKL